MADCLEAGFRLDRYEIVGMLRREATGIEYEATEVGGGETVVIREFMLDGLMTRAGGPAVSPVSGGVRAVTDAGLEHFLTLHETLRSIRHSAVPEVRECLRAFGTGYAVMGVTPGESLSALLETSTTLAQEELAGVLFPVVDGLERLHGANVLHRAIIPDSIVVRPDGSPVLCGFGGAQVAAGGARQTFGRRPPGLTPHLVAGYAALEQYSGGGRQGAWTDIYSLGAVAYRCVAGSAPPDAPGRAAHDDMVPAVRIAGKSYDPRLLRGIDAALAVRAGDRPNSVAAWRAALRGTAPASSPRTQPPSRVAARQFRPPESAIVKPAFGQRERAPASDAAEMAAKRWGGVVPALALTALVALVTWLDTAVLRSGNDVRAADGVLGPVAQVTGWSGRSSGSGYEWVDGHGEELRRRVVAGSCRQRFPRGTAGPAAAIQYGRSTAKCFWRIVSQEAKRDGGCAGVGECCLDGIAGTCGPPVLPGAARWTVRWRQ